MLAVAPPMFEAPMPPPMYAMPEPAVLIDDEATFRPGDIDDYPQIDYRYFRYSRFATPWLLLMLGFFIVLFGLTLWQGDLTIKEITPGRPRDLEPWAEDDRGDGGISRKVRNMRIATGIIAVIPPLLAALIYYVNFRPKMTRILIMVLVLICVVDVVMGIITFCLDLGQFHKVEICETQIGTQGLNRACQQREALGVAAVTLDFCAALFALVSAIMLLLWKNYFRREHISIERAEIDRELDAPEYVDQAGMKLVVPGQPTVYKTLIGLGLFALLVSGILLILFSILIHELRERVVGVEWDPENGDIGSGWPKQNTRLRLVVSIWGILLVLLSLVPYPHRVYAYLLAFAFFGLCVMCFVLFALDVSQLKKARDLDCPDIVKCIYHPYNTVVVWDFLCGILVALYIIVEFLVRKKKTYVAAREYTAVDIIDDYDMGPATFLGGPSRTLDERKLEPVEAPKAPGRLRPLLGIEVVEMEHPATGELNVSVLSVAEGGAADEAGIRVGDIITRWNDMPIRSKADFAAAVQDSAIGSTVTLQLIRQGPAGLGGSMEYARLTIRGVPA